MTQWKKLSHSRKLILAGIVLLTTISLMPVAQNVLAQRMASRSVQPSPLHPTFMMLDKNEINVIESGEPVSTLKTCGQCHDTDFIVSHSYHSDAGLNNFGVPRQIPNGLPWDSSNGLFGKWDPLLYRTLTVQGDQYLDLSTAEWITTYGLRHVGGGPAETNREGEPLASLDPSIQNPEASVLNNKTGIPQKWDWQESGTIEMNCFLCHFTKPNNGSRIAAMVEGEFAWANTATLVGTGLVDKVANRFQWNSDAFDQDGKLKPEYVLVQDPKNENCAQCHGLVQADPATPVVLSGCDLDYPETATTGQIISSQRISESGMNIQNKASLVRSWDIHAERAVSCTDCHYSLNNPIYAIPDEQAPEHLLFDPRNLDLGEYLQRPDHNFARGQTEASDTSSGPEMRRCDSCHDYQASHADWLPYVDRHMATVACETCHIPEMYAPAIQSYDWTVINQDSSPFSTCRGVEGDTGTINDLVTGYKPVVLQRTEADGKKLLAPYNLITSYFWIYTDENGNERPVRLIDLEAAFLENGKYTQEIVSAFDANGDQQIVESEMIIDNDAKLSLVASQLTEQGLTNPRMQGYVQAYAATHGVTSSEYAINDCAVCHDRDSRVASPILLSNQSPAGEIPAQTTDPEILSSGEITRGADGSINFSPQTEDESIYILGYSYVFWVDALGALMFVGAMLAILVHATIRITSNLRHKPPKGEVHKVYMYDSYERLWHWLQTAAIVILLFTGLVIHRPDLFGAFSFRNMVYVHNILWMLLAINAALSLFYHLASGRIKQFIPRPYGFFDEAILQAKYYIQGIFKHEPHPFEKTPEKKMNPLQQITYFGILNVLLPLQGLTGIAMWGVQRWPGITTPLGGLVWLAPFHTLIAWTFATFILAHVYLTTTGSKPLDGIKGMVTGWEDVEAAHQDINPEQDSPDDTTENVQPLTKED